ncbi:MAG: hypothetical protein SGPRY_004428 [Prymnesium sp.]
MSALASIARIAWSELLGRAAALQLTVDKTTLPESLLGFELPEVLAATSGGYWSALDLGSCYRKVRARLRTTRVSESLAKARACATHQDVKEALEVAEPLLALRGFPGAGPHTLPFALEQVAQTWKLYGGEGSSPHLRERIAEEGREFILASLRRFGQVRHAFVSGKNPKAARYCTETLLAACRRFKQHTAKLAGALAVRGYVRPPGCPESHTYNMEGGRQLP